ncbi:MAG TPA: hypothetical protein VGP08_18625 [Pyrinomonadaceae bacterium]|nr:hypothetical protein [Pyrinomonadaceae bacterium]
MYILIVEDDQSQAGLIEAALRNEPDFYSPKIVRISTESQFRARFEEITAKPPDAIVMDVMLRWADPIPDMLPPPEDVQKEGCFRAGLRNAKLLAHDERTSKIPVILYTMLEKIDLDGMTERRGIAYLPKDSTLDPLVQAIRAVISPKSD